MRTFRVPFLVAVPDLYSNIRMKLSGFDDVCDAMVYMFVVLDNSLSLQPHAAADTQKLLTCRSWQTGSHKGVVRTNVYFCGLKLR